MFYIYFVYLFRLPNETNMSIQKLQWGVKVYHDEYTVASELNDPICHDTVQYSHKT